MKYDDNGRICNRCEEYKTWDNYHKQGSNSRSPHGKHAICKQCRSKAYVHVPRTAHREQEGDLYMLECAGYYKIGITTNLESRLKHYETHNPHPVTVVKVWPGRADLERDVHDMLGAFHHKGEWFQPN